MTEEKQLKDTLNLPSTPDCLPYYVTSQIVIYMEKLTQMLLV